MSCCDTVNLMPVDAAIANMLEHITPCTQTESVHLTKASYRITATDIVSPINVPAFANSAMDGYAVRRSCLEKSMTLPLAGKSMAGAPFTGDWPLGTCIRIMTGAAVPELADAVVMQEQVEVTENNVTFTAMPKLNENIRPIGDDVKQGDIVLAKGSMLSLKEMPILASLGIEYIDVFKKIKVAFFSTGDELKQVGESLATGEIYDSNRYTIAHWLEKMHYLPIDLGVVADDKAALSQAFLQAARQADLIITSGGVSVGEADFTKEVLEEVGEINFWKLAIKPGKPFAFGKIDNALFCGLPGNPVSALVTLHVLVSPILAKLSGHSTWQAPLRFAAIAQTGFKKRPGRTDYQRGHFSVNENGQLVVSNINNQSSGAFSSMVKANCFAILEQQRGNIAIGDTVMIEPFALSLD